LLRQLLLRAWLRGAELGLSGQPVQVSLDG
jgi:hypothetical protein